VITRLLPLILALPLSAADLTGIWVGQIPGRNDEVQDIAFQFQQTGAKLAGKLYGDYQSSPIAVGTVSGVVVSFIVRGTEQAGNEINETRTRFSGRFLDNGELEWTRERESSHAAGNGGTAEQRKNAPRLTFRVKRLT